MAKLETSKRRWVALALIAPKTAVKPDYPHGLMRDDTGWLRWTTIGRLQLSVLSEKVEEVRPDGETQAQA